MSPQRRFRHLRLGPAFAKAWVMPRWILFWLGGAASAIVACQRLPPGPERAAAATAEASEPRADTCDWQGRWRLALERSGDCDITLATLELEFRAGDHLTFTRVVGDLETWEWHLAPSACTAELRGAVAAKDEQ